MRYRVCAELKTKEILTMANGMLNKDERRAIVSTTDEADPKLSERQLGAIRRDMVNALGRTYPYVQLSDYSRAAMSLRLEQAEKHLTLLRKSRKVLGDG